MLLNPDQNLQLCSTVAPGSWHVLGLGAGEFVYVGHMSSYFKI